MQTVVARLVKVGPWPLSQLWSPPFFGPRSTPSEISPEGTHKELSDFQVGLVTSGESSQNGSRDETVQRSAAAEVERTRHFGHS